MACPLQSGATSELSRRGWELTNAGEVANGIACHRVATAMASASSYDWFHRSRAEQLLGLTDDAEVSLNRATSMTSPRLDGEVATEAYFQLGKVSRDLGKTERAEAAYRQSVALAPASPGARNSILIPRDVRVIHNVAFTAAVAYGVRKSNMLF